MSPGIRFLFGLVPWPRYGRLGAVGRWVVWVMDQQGYQG